MNARNLFVALLIFVANGAVHASQSSFGIPSRLTVERGVVENIATGDMDGDGRIDLAVTDHVSPGEHRVRLYFQAAGGVLSTPLIVPISSDLNDVYSVAASDLEGDGAAETIVGALGGINIVHWGPARIPYVKYYEGVSASCRVITTGDVDGDGNQDIACHNRNEWPNRAVVYFGDGRGGVRNIVSADTPAGQGLDFKALQIGDVNGDGRADLVVTAASSPAFYVLPNDGRGGFLPAVTYPHPASAAAGWPASLLVLDLDGDGLNEVITADSQEAPAARLNIYGMTGGGALALRRQIPIPSSTTALIAGDAGNDGDLDLILGHWSYGSVTVIGDQDSGIETQTNYELPGFGNEVMYQIRTGSTNALALADLNGDGCSDLVAATYSGIKVLLGCKPSFRVVPVSDFDGDGVSDLFWRQGQMGGLMMFWPWASKAAYFGCPLPCPPYLGLPPFINQAVGDFDGDGSSDIFYRNSQTGENQLVLRGFYVSPGATIQNPDWQVVGAGDFDGDDRSDLFWRNGRTGQTLIWKGGVYSGLVWELPVPDLNWRVAAIGDFDGDGYSDVFWKHALSGRNIIWWRGRGLALQEVTRVINTQWHVFGAGDFNGDGRDDVVWRNVATGAGIIWYSGNYSSQTAMTTITNLSWRIVAVGDYDGDGKSDLMWQNQSTGANIVWRAADYRKQMQVEALDPSYKPVI
jgi:hypothetical protein